eukprot:12430099-Karenia_brevis.AAC.1
MAAISCSTLHPILILSQSVRTSLELKGKKKRSERRHELQNPSLRRLRKRKSIFAKEAKV